MIKWLNIRNKIVLSGWFIFALSIASFLQGTSMIMALLIVLYFIDKKPHIKFLHQFKNAYTYIFMLPFMLAIAGMINTENMQEGWHFVEVSLAFAIFPFLASDFKQIKNKSKWKNLFLAFVLGLIITFLICLVRALIRYPEVEATYIFFYIHFTDFIMAPNHLSNYVVFGVVLVAMELVNHKQTYLPIKSFFILLILLVVLIVFLVMLASKASLLFLALLAGYFFIYLGRHKILSWLVIAIIGLFTFSGGLIVINQTILKTRIQNMSIALKPDRIDYTVAESTTTRLSAMQASTDLITQNWQVGVGTGDVRGELKKYYKANQYIAAYKYETHPHNQFLRSTLAYGIPGLLSLILLFFMIFREAYRTKKSLIWLWGSMMLILFLTDDMISIHAGITYFTMFTALFTFAINSKNYDTIFTSKNR